jgi:hypothetical protein
MLDPDPLHEGQRELSCYPGGDRVGSFEGVYVNDVDNAPSPPTSSKDRNAPRWDFRGCGSPAVLVGASQDVANTKDDIVERGKGLVTYLARRLRQTPLVFPDFHSYNGVYMARDTRAAFGF